MDRSLKDNIKKVLALVIKLLILTSIIIVIWNIFFYVSLPLFIGSIGFIISIGVIGLTLEIYDYYSDKDSEVDKILNKWMNSDKKELLRAKICPSCGQEQSLEIKKCSNCGHIFKLE